MKNHKIHECDKLPAEGVQIIYSAEMAKRNDMTWCLVIRREATEDDLEENHYLEEVGDIIWETFLEIIHCPFCGKYLPDIAGKTYPDHGLFMHFDCSD